MKSSAQDQAEGEFHQVKGKIKEVTGKLSDNNELEADDTGEKVAGKVQDRIRLVRSRKVWGTSEGGEIMSSQIEGFVKGAILGGLIGAAIGILYAPQSGRKTREDISGKAEELLTKAKEEYEAALKKSGKAFDAAVKQLKHLESSAKEKVREMEKKVDELTELGREALHDTEGHMAKAVNAAAHAFK